MSFSKAKIHRYYDDISCAPSPGKYDPKVQKKVKAPVFDKGSRFSTPKMEHASSVESLDSCCSSSSKTPLFRTPSNRSGKKAVLPFTPTKSTLRGKLVLPDKINPTKLTEPDKHLLEEIKELTRVHQNQLVEKNEEVANLIEQINTLNNKIANLLNVEDKTKTKNEYEREINQLKKELIDLQALISSNESNYKNHVDDLKSQISNLEENIENHITINKDLETSLHENSLIYDEINKRINEMAADFTLQLSQYKESMDRVEILNKSLFDDYNIMLDILKKESEENLINKETISGLQESINVCKDELSYTLKRCRMYEVVQTETSKTINVLSKRLRESELEVDHLNDVQQELLTDKNNLEEQVNCLSVENQLIRDTLDTFQQSIKLEIETMQNQLVQKVETYKQLAMEESNKQKICLEEKQKTIEMLLQEITFYKNKKIEDDIQITSCQAKMTSYQENIAVLKSALTDLEYDFQEKMGAQKALFSQLSEEYESLKELSIKEKEQLEEKLSNLDKVKSTLENACIEKANKINLLQEEAKHANSILSQSQAKIKQLEDLTNNFNNDLEKMAQELEDKQNNVKTAEKVKDVNKDFDLEKLNQTLKEQGELIQLLEYEKMVQALTFEESSEQKDELLKVIERQNREIEALSETADRHYAARRELEQEINRLQEEKELLKEAGKEDSMKVTSLEAALADLECRNRELTEIIGPFKNQLMQFETERNFFLSKSENTEKELRLLEMEHAKSLGHQNHKQKIKHIVNLNQNIATLKKEMEKFRLENIKLKHELSAKKPSSLGSIKKNKENKNKAPPKERNTSPASVLKDRN